MKHDPDASLSLILRSLAGAKPRSLVKARIVAKAMQKVNAAGRQGASERHRPRKWVVLGLLGASASALVLVLWSLAGDPSTSSVASKGLEFRETGASEEPFMLGPHAVVLGPQSRLRMAKVDAADTLLELETGRVRCSVERGPGQAVRNFRVKTNQALVEVTGTEFEVAVGHGCTTVRVEEGHVRVLGVGVTRELHRGDVTEICDPRDREPPKRAQKRLERERSDDTGRKSRDAAPGGSEGLTGLEDASDASGVFPHGTKGSRRALAKNQGDLETGKLDPRDVAEEGAEEAPVREALVLISEGRDLGRATRLLESYLASHRRGVFAEEALFHLTLLERRLGHVKASRDRAAEFKRRFPESRRAQRLDELEEKTQAE